MGALTSRATRQDKSTGDVVDSTVNPAVVASEYAVLGAIATRAAEIEEDLKAEDHGYDFDSVVYCNIGNPHAFQQKPVSYCRRLLACCECSEVANMNCFPRDVVARSQEISAAMDIGAYTDSAGNQFIRELVASGISRRDSHKASPDDIFLSGTCAESTTCHEVVSACADGASTALDLFLSAMIKDSRDAFLVPVPQYPLYSAALTMHGGTLVPYFLHEGKGWAIDVHAIRKEIVNMKARGLRVRGVVVINPGNPTGQVLSLANQVQLLEVCAAAGVPIIADEVYQQNVWAEGKVFTSFYKVLSLNSTSKGFFGECGHRGGYMHAFDCPENILEQVLKLMGIFSCSNTAGQVMTAALMAPPIPGDESYEEYKSETDAILDSLKRRATKMVHAVRQLEGVTCCNSEGAMYAFPKLTIPPGAQAAAKAAGVQPDFLYCLELVNATGIVTVPGSGFKQAPGTYHLRVSILPQEAEIDAVITRLSAFHSSFMDKYRKQPPTAADD